MVFTQQALKIELFQAHWGPPKPWSPEVRLILVISWVPHRKLPVFFGVTKVTVVQPQQQDELDTRLQTHADAEKPPEM
jgi:hypothetical protein